ncbi:MAG: hypothetical protein ACJ8DI_08420 [Ktedonobacteraceae bacterium]
MPSPSQFNGLFRLLVPTVLKPRLGDDDEAAAAKSSAMGDAMSAAMGPLMMIGTAAALVGGKLVSMGMDGQKGEALLSGMAGASQADIVALQGEALKLGLTMDKASAGFYEVESAGIQAKRPLRYLTPL